jgi:hypothetical protein
MKKTWIGCILMAALLLMNASGIMASDLTCGSKIITPGYRSSDVLARCGRPSYVQTRTEIHIERDNLDIIKIPVTIEEWEYNLGPNRFIRYLKFENGRLIEITEGDYGYQE